MVARFTRWTMHWPVTLSLALLLVIFSSAVAVAQEPDDCSLEFKGKARKEVKLRTKDDGLNYKKHNNGDPIAVKQWHKLMCSFDSKVPSDLRKIPAKNPMKRIETVDVTLRGYLMAVKYEKKGDQDFHVEIGEVSDWETPHVVVEVPPGEEWCEARKAIWQMVKDDAKKADRRTATRYIFKEPPEILVEGYVFLDSPHAGHCRTLEEDFCECDGGRGITDGDHDNMVQGIWEIHPVISVHKVSTE